MDWSISDGVSMTENIFFVFHHPFISGRMMVFISLRGYRVRCSSCGKESRHWSLLKALIVGLHHMAEYCPKGGFIND